MMAILMVGKHRAVGVFAICDPVLRHMLHLSGTAHAGLRLRLAHHIARRRRTHPSNEQDGHDHSENAAPLHKLILHLI